MATNVERFKNDLARLIKLGDVFDQAMAREIINDKDFRQQVSKAIGSEKVDEFIKKLPNFKLTYELWYSEALALLRQLLPDRIANFISFYEKAKGRKEVNYGNYVIQDFMQNLQVKLGSEIKVEPSAAIHQFRQQLAIVKAARRRFDSSLFEIRQLVQADLFDGEIDTAKELLKNKFFRAAGAMAGVVLEKHLAQVCSDHSISVTKKNPGISDFNELLKGNGVIDVPQWRHISLLADIRNLCDHNKQKEPTAEQVTDLIDGVTKTLKTVA